MNDPTIPPVNNNSISPVLAPGEVIAKTTKTYMYGIIGYVLFLVAVGIFLCFMAFLNAMKGSSYGDFLRFTALPMLVGACILFFFGYSIRLALRLPKITKLYEGRLTVEPLIGDERTIDLQVLKRVETTILTNSRHSEKMLRLTGSDGTTVYVHFGAIRKEERAPFLEALRPYVENPDIRKNDDVIKLMDQWTKW